MSQNLQLVPPACRSIPPAGGPSSLARSPEGRVHAVLLIQLGGLNPRIYIATYGYKHSTQQMANARICYVLFLSTCIKNCKTQLQILHEISYKHENEGPPRTCTCSTFNRSHRAIRKWPGVFILTFDPQTILQHTAANQTNSCHLEIRFFSKLSMY